MKKVMKSEDEESFDEWYEEKALPLLKGTVPLAPDGETIRCLLSLTFLVGIQVAADREIKRLERLVGVEDE